MRIVILVSFLIIGQLVLGQPPTEPEKIDFTKYTTLQRQAFYPFNKASQIKLVSFSHPENEADKRKAAIWGLPIANDSICLSKLDQIIELSATQIDSLTDILFNTCFRWTMISTTHMGCYFPRNAILFFDTSVNPFAYIEICFECQGIKRSSAEIAAPELCDLTYRDLQAFFRTHGLKTSATELLKKNVR